MEEYLASFEFPSAKTLISLLETIGEVADEVLVRLDPSGLHVRALDPARLSLMELEIPPTAFTSFDVRTSELGVGVNLNSLLKMLPRPKKADVLKFSANKSFYKINIEGTTSKSFKLRSIEVQAEEIQELKIEFKVRAIVLSNAFKQALTSLGGVDVIEIEVPSADYMVLRGGNSTVKLSRLAGSVLDIEFKESAKSSYEESYISKITPLLGLTDNLEISLKSSSPLSMVFRISGDILVRYILAPRD